MGKSQLTLFSLEGTILLEQRNVREIHRLVNTSSFLKAKCIPWFCHFTSTMPLCGYQVKIFLQQDHFISSIKMLIFAYII